MFSLIKSKKSNEIKKIDIPTTDKELDDNINVFNDCTFTTTITNNILVNNINFLSKEDK